MYYIVKFVLFYLIFFAQINAQQVLIADKTDAILKAPIEEVSDNQSRIPYASYTNLVMAGYQGWFAAEGDDSNRGWYHYGIKGDDTPGRTTVDMWPDMTEYTKKYKSPFQYSDGSSAYLYSSYDEETIDLHFKWMKEYGIDGVHMQRFLSEVTSDKSKGKQHFNKVLKSALKAAKKGGFLIIENAIRLRKIALLGIVMYFFESLATFVASNYLSDKLQFEGLEFTSINSYLFFDIQTVIYSLFLLVISEAFRMGALLKQEVDLTI